MTDVIEKSRRAKQLQSSTAFKEAMDDVKDALYAEWEKAPDTAAREEIYFTLAGIKRFIKQLSVTADRGTIAESAANPDRKPLTI